MRIRYWTLYFAVLLLELPLTGYMERAQSAPADARIPRARFNADGTIIRPTGYRAWSHIGTRYKSAGIMILDGLPLQSPEISNAYAEPHALAAYAKTGHWPDGTQIVKEFSKIVADSHCDAATHVCTNSYGQGIFESGYVGLGMMVKDKARFPTAPGNWGYFSFGHQPPPYMTSSPPRSVAQCEGCHVALASDTDYVLVGAQIGLKDFSGD